MDDFEAPGVDVADLGEDDFDKLYDELEEDLNVERGGPAARLAAFFGFWRPPSGHNLRVGILSGDKFLPVDTPNLDLVREGEAVNLVLNRFYLPDLPHERCTAQVMWTAAHWFRDSKKTQVTHTTACNADELGTASAVGLPVFEGLRVKDGIGLNVTIYVMADRASQPILDLLSSPVVSGGLKLAGKFNPIFAATGPYIQAAIKGLIQSSKKNFRLVNWLVGFGTGAAPVPLAYGDYILLDGIVRLGREGTALAWEDLRWDASRECVMYQDGRFRNPYLMMRVLRNSE